MEISEEELTNESNNPEVEIKPASDDGEPEMPKLVLAAVGLEDVDIGVNDLNIDFDETWEAEVWNLDEEEMVNKEFNISHNEDFSWENIDVSDFSQLPDDIEDDVRLWGIEDLALYGGEASFSVNVDNYIQEFAFEIKGENTGEETVLDYTGEKASDDLWYAEAIASQESIGGKQFVDEATPGYVMLNEKGVTLVGYPDGWGVMQLEEDARNAAAGNDREMVWHWQKNVDGGINRMEDNAYDSRLYFQRFRDTYPYIGGPPSSYRGYSSKDILAIQLYNGAATSERLYVPWANNSDKYETAYEKHGDIGELSDADRAELTTFYLTSWYFEQEGNELNWSFISNTNNYVFEKVLND